MALRPDLETTVSRTGAKAGNILVGVLNTNKGMRIRIKHGICRRDQNNGTNPPLQDFRLLDAGHGRYSPFLAEFVEQDWTVRRILDAIRAKYPRFNGWKTFMTENLVLEGSDIADASVLQTGEPQTVESPPRAEKESDTSRSRTESSHLDDIDIRQTDHADIILGNAGEEFVINYERGKLQSIGRADLASRVEQVSRTIGHKAGYDVRSFEPDGAERFIEVKTTSGNKRTPFYITDKELEFARVHADNYHIYRVFDLRSPESAKFFILEGPIEQHCHLQPLLFRASFD